MEKECLEELGSKIEADIVKTMQKTGKTHEEVAIDWMDCIRKALGDHRFAVRPEAHLQKEGV